MSDERQATSAERPRLRLVQPLSDQPSSRWFCGYCGAAPCADGAPAPVNRVCRQCGEGLLLEAPAGTAPERHEAFLVVDGRLTVQAVSKQAERILGVAEPEATDRPVADLLEAADAEREVGEGFTDMLARAASSEESPSTTFVRPRGTFGVRLRARISFCGPPRAGLIVLESGRGDGAPDERHLRLVTPAAAAQGG